MVCKSKLMESNQCMDICSKFESSEAQKRIDADLDTKNYCADSDKA